MVHSLTKNVKKKKSVISFRVAYLVEWKQVTYMSRSTRPRSNDMNKVR